MKITNLLYSNQEGLKEDISKAKIGTGSNCLVQIFTASEKPNGAVEIAKEVKALLPECHIIGGSASGVIYNCTQVLNGTIITINQFNSSKIYSSIFSFANKTADEFAKEVTHYMEGKNVELAHVICSDHYYDVNDFVDGFNKYNSRTKLVGGVTGDILPDNIMGYVFDDSGVYDNSIMVGCICGNQIYTYSGVNISHDPISPKYRLTDILGNQWKSINGENADNWIREQLGIEKFEGYKDWQIIANNDVMVRFPMILEGHNGGSRFLRYDKDVNGLTQYFSRIPKDAEFRIGYVSPSQCAKESFEMCNEIMEQPIESMFCYTCLFRRLYLHNCSEWELKPYRGLGLCGAFMMGEIANINGTNEFLNGSCCMVGVAENEVYVRPDIAAFEELGDIEDDTQELLNIALKRQSEKISLYNEELLDKLVNQQQSAHQQMMVDINTGIGNFLKYTEDIKTLHFNKMCMIKIENDELVIAHLGHSSFQDSIGHAVKKINECINDINKKNNEHIAFYVFNQSTVFLVANVRMNEERFMSICNTLFDKFRFITLRDSEEIFVCRFVLVSNQGELIENALNTLQAGKNVQTPFLVCNPGEDDISAEEEFKMIGVLNRAIENNGIVPYFQGIYDNVEKKITKYEALMRIVDVDGSVYTPYSFMDIAKKYHLYTPLSKKMLNNVFELFENYEDTVDINLSVFDIHSSEMQNFIFEKLKMMKNPSRFVLEILEDEEFRDIDLLHDFVKRAKAIGAQIAIDDFGAGYSNLMEIASIAPDVIKVDGSIIRALDTNEHCRKILDVIVYLGRMFDASIVAEFVENEAIQRHIEFFGIRYSQGYYFSKPVPYN